MPFLGCRGGLGIQQPVMRVSYSWHSEAALFTNGELDEGPKLPLCICCPLTCLACEGEGRGSRARPAPAEGAAAPAVVVAAAASGAQREHATPPPPPPPQWLPRPGLPRHLLPQWRPGCQERRSGHNSSRRRRSSCTHAHPHPQRCLTITGSHLTPQVAPAVTITPASHDVTCTNRRLAVNISQLYCDNRACE